MQLMSHMNAMIDEILAMLPISMVTLWLLKCVSFNDYYMH